MSFHPLPSRRALAVAALVASLLLAFGAGSAQEDPEVPRDADAILDAMVENLRGSGQRATMHLTVERPSETRTYRLEIVSDGTERSLTRVIEPPRDAGQAFLVDGSELFVYSPRLGRVLRLPPSGRSDGFLGSDLSYDDLAGDELRDRYDASVAEWREEEVELSLLPRTGAPTPYGELRFTASLPDLAPLALDYFDQRDQVVKRLRFSAFETTPSGHRVPRRFEVTDLTREGGRTVAEWTEVEDDVSPPERCFTQQALERGCDE
ncbi:MAG: outer membrane lipoprotein-sorting protein [Trueperaceae bacterium]|nr:outer membrane lipoprotein-sorting protein [Trueperaceae bacterium]